MNSKMILTDLAHTLLRSDGSISDYTKRILKKCQSCGILVVKCESNHTGFDRTKSK